MESLNKHCFVNNLSQTTKNVVAAKVTLLI